MSFGIPELLANLIHHSTKCIRHAVTLFFPPISKFELSVLGCIETKSDDQIPIGKRLTRSLKVQIINNPSEALSVNKKYLPVIPIKIDAKTQLGERNYSNAGAILQSIDMAIDFAKQKVISGIVTNPINKEVIAKKLMRFKGHTEYLAKKDKKSNELMFLLNKNLKI